MRCETARSGSSCCLSLRLPHVFDRNLRGKYPLQAQISGTGLGSAIAQEIVALHGGWVGDGGKQRRRGVYVHHPTAAHRLDGAHSHRVALPATEPRPIARVTPSPFPTARRRAGICGSSVQVPFPSRVARSDHGPLPPGNPTQAARIRRPSKGITLDARTAPNRRSCKPETAL